MASGQKVMMVKEVLNTMSLKTASLNIRSTYYIDIEEVFQVFLACNQILDQFVIEEYP